MGPTHARERSAIARLAAIALLAGTLLGRAALARAGAARAVPPVIVADPGPFASIAAAAVAEREVHWNDGDARAARACTECFAAVELRHFLARALALPESAIMLAAAPPRDGAAPLVVLGSDLRRAALGRLDTTAAPPLPAGEGQGFRIFPSRVAGRAATVIEGAGRVGTLYGAYAFLERLGCRWYALGEQGASVPHLALPLPDTLAASEAPAFTTRGFWAWEPRGTPELFAWMARNRMNLWTALEPSAATLHKLGIRLIAGGHEIQKVCLDPDAPDSTGTRTRFAAHPEWYGLREGQRSARVTDSTGVNFCTSNPQAVATLARNLVRELATGRWRDADELALWMHDDGRWCECERCRAAGGPTDRLLDLAHACAAELQRARADGRLKRDVKLSTLAFLETLAPPRRAHADAVADGIAVTFFPMDRCYAHALADTACEEINALPARVFRAWGTDSTRAWRGPVAVGEYYNIGDLHSFPMVLTHVIAADLATYHAAGVREFHFMHVLHRDWGPWILDHALLARLLWNPARNADSLESDFLARWYPATSPDMRTFYAAMESTSANMKLLMGRVRVGNAIFRLSHQVGGGGEPLPLRHMHLDARHPRPDDAPDLADVEHAIATARAALARARASARDPDERAHLAALQGRFEYGDALVTFYVHFIRLVHAELAGDAGTVSREWPKLGVAGERLRWMTDVVQVSSAHANCANGLAATGLEGAYRALLDRYGMH